MQHSPCPVSEVVEELLSRLPETDRTISACEMAAKCDIPREENDGLFLCSYKRFIYFSALYFKGLDNVSSCCLCKSFF